MFRQRLYQNISHIRWLHIGYQSLAGVVRIVYTLVIKFGGMHLEQVVPTA